MTHGALHVSAIALGVAAFVSVLPLSTASADPPAPGLSAPSLAEPAPTPSMPTPAAGATASAPGEPAGAVVMPPERPSRLYVGHSARHARYASRHGHRYAYRRAPFEDAATGVVGAVADLGSIAAYPLYCFPNYGSCRFYRFYP
jgi:hypothetical protein